MSVVKYLKLQILKHGNDLQCKFFLKKVNFAKISNLRFIRKNLISLFQSVCPLFCSIWLNAVMLMIMTGTYPYLRIAWWVNNTHNAFEKNQTLNYYILAFSCLKSHLKLRTYLPSWLKAIYLRLKILVRRNINNVNFLH